MEKRERSVQLHFYVTEDEYAIIQRRMARAETANFSRYARTMLVNGYIIHQDFTVLRELAKELRAQADALAAREAALEQARDELSQELDQDQPPQARQGGPEL